MSDAPTLADVRGVLFDVDGTLVDTGYLHAVAWWQAFRRVDLDVPIATIHRAIGMGSDHLIPHVLRESGLDPDNVDADRVSETHGAIFSTFWPSLRALPGAAELVRLCHDAGKITVLASSAKQPDLAVLRRVLDVDDALDHVTASDDADQSKPSPDLVQAGLETAGLSADEAVFVGDAVWDVQAAHEAGVPCVAVECGGTSAAELQEAGALAVFRDPSELAAFWRSTR